VNYKQAIQAVEDWEQNNSEKHLAWTWFVKGVKEAECWQYNECGNEDAMPFQKAVGEFSVEYDFWHREQNPDQYNQDMPENFYLQDRDIIGGII
jgi:hypothetical protein